MTTNPLSRTRWGTVVRAGLGAACLLVPAWVALTRWSALVAGHPAYPVLLVVLGLLAVLLLARVGRGADRRPGWATVRRGRRLGSCWSRCSPAAAWLRPFAAEPVAVAGDRVLADRRGRRQRDDRGSCGRGGGPADAGVAFFPGALVDPRAYLALLRPLAERGYLVVVVKPPLGVALLSTADAALDAASRGGPVGGRRALAGRRRRRPRQAARRGPARAGRLLLGLLPDRGPLARPARRRLGLRRAGHGDHAAGSRSPAPSCRPAPRSPRCPARCTRSSATTARSPATGRRPRAGPTRSARSWRPPSGSSPGWRSPTDEQVGPRRPGGSPQRVGGLREPTWRCDVPPALRRPPDPGPIETPRP